MRVVAAVPGDLDLDGKVDVDDLAILAANWQQAGVSWVNGDLTGHGVVNVSDLSVLAAHWHAGVTASGISFGEAAAMFDVFDGAVVPEPGAMGLLGLVLYALRGRGRRWRIARCAGVGIHV